jgi:DNA invertase Pin-like site-specific DNA recombinase
MAQLVVSFAEFEREAIRGRALDAYRVKQQAGAYPHARGFRYLGAVPVSGVW